MPSVSLLYVLLFGCSLCHGYTGTISKEELSSTAGTGVPLADRLWANLKLRHFYSFVDKLKFCFDFRGDDEVLMLLRKTLPSETLAVAYKDNDTAKDDICGRWERMEPYICQTEADYLLYLRFVLYFDDPNKIPDTTECDSRKLGTEEGYGCLPGFFSTKQQSLNGSQENVGKMEKGYHKCCEGFFCPQMMNCMIPCPLGATCPRALSKNVSKTAFKGLNVKGERICAPYEYRRAKVGCGGADKWDYEPFPARFGLEGNRGNIFCPSESYCENTVDEPRKCADGYYCRVGSTSPTRCPPLTVCKAGASLPDDYFGFALCAIVFVLLALAWKASEYYNRILRRLSAREQFRIRWGMHLHLDVVHRSPENQNGDVASPIGESPFARGPIGNPSREIVRPKLIALRMISSTLSRTFTRPMPDRQRTSRPPPVWANLSQELRPYDDEQQQTPPVEEERIPIGITIEFYALSLKVKSLGKEVVTTASGKFEASKLTAVLGPSGCGKTSLLCFLACQGEYSVTNGVILINGRESTLKRYHKVTGFVPQDDIVHPKLTVEENLLFSARHRLEKETPRSTYLSTVDQAIQLLGLTDVRSQLVGNEESRGISGGQRKRVNLGLELVADPSILFLDEPTSGLDATSTRHVLSALAKIAHMGVTCAAVVHQPSNRVMIKFDNVLLLGIRGHTVYYGPQQGLKDYFMSLGFAFSIDDNPADVYLDIVTRPKHAPVAPQKSLAELYKTSVVHDRYLSRPELDVEIFTHSNDRATGTDGATNEEQFEIVERIKNTIWMAIYLIISPFSQAIECIQSIVASFRRNGRWNGYTGLGNGPDEDLRATPGFVKQFWLCFYRCILERSRNVQRIFTEYALFAVSGMLLGMLADSRTSGRLKPFVADMNFNTVAIGLMTTVASLRTFSQNQLLFSREARAGLNKLAHCCAVAIFGDVGSILKGLCYLSLYYSYAQPRALFSDFFLVTTALIYSTSGFGYLISKLFKPGPSQLAAAIFVLSNAMLARPSSSNFMTFTQYFLYHSWAVEAFMISEARQLFGVWSLERCGTLRALHYDVRDFPYCIVALFFLGISTRLIAFGFIKYGMRDKSE